MLSERLIKKLTSFGTTKEFSSIYVRLARKGIEKSKKKDLHSFPMYVLCAKLYFNQVILMSFRTT